MTPIGGSYLLIQLITLFMYMVFYRRGYMYHKLIILYLAVSIIGGVISINIIGWLNMDNNYVVFHILLPIQYTIWSLVYYYTIVDDKLRKTILVSIPVYMVTSIVFSLFIQPINENNAYMFVIDSVLVIVWSLLFIRETIIIQKERRLQEYPMFWVSIGILFYYVGNLVIEGSLNYLMSISMDVARNFYKFSFIFKFLLFFLLMLAAVCKYVFRVREK